MIKIDFDRTYSSRPSERHHEHLWPAIILIAMGMVMMFGVLWALLTLMAP